MLENDLQPPGNGGEGLVPGSALEGSVRHSAERMREPLIVMGVVRDGEPLVADVSAGDRISVVAPHRCDLAIGDVDAETAVVAAQYTDCREIECVGGNGRLRDGGVDGDEFAGQ